MSSQVDRHPNIRLAYVAQHAFHHLEESLDISPVRYILRRYLGGEDKEESSKVGGAAVASPRTVKIYKI